MWNKPSKERLARIPRLYDSEQTPLKEKRIYLHFFIGGSDWYVAEYDGGDLFWGYAILNGDFEMAEWGYFSFTELRLLSVGGIEVDCELGAYFKPQDASAIDKICKGMRWPMPSNKVPCEEDQQLSDREGSV